jgi:hypothetical protein
VPEIRVDDFARRFQQRKGNLMWLLGAGASAAAGIPTAAEMIWDFKRQLFVSQRRVSPKSVADLANPAVQRQIQAHIEGAGGLPRSGDADEYAAFFEVAYQAEADRQAYIESKVRGAKPSYGHLALATLMKSDCARIVWTPNFDPLVADGCAKVYEGTGHLTTVSPDASHLAAERINAGRWPIEVKLHGDFRSRRLKNTTDELRMQDAKLRQVLLDCCGRWGLVVIGYSGRDASIVETLESAFTKPTPFPAGLFWLHAVLPAVTSLLDRATKAGVEAALVRIENFDETLRDLIRVVPDLDTKALDAFAADRRHWTPAPVPSGSRGWPVIRFNGISVESLPTVCRRINCEIGGHSEVVAAVKAASATAVVTRTRAGVLAFGADADLRAAFQGHGITDSDLHTIEVSRLRMETGERGLLREALSRALSRQHDLTVEHRRSADHLWPTNPDDPKWAPLKKLVGAVAGTVSQLEWREAVSLRLDWAADRPWLLVDPRTYFLNVNDANRAVATDFARERTVRRYNKALNDLIAFWSDLLASEGRELRALGISDGVDAVFHLSASNCFSRRSGS